MAKQKIVGYALYHRRYRSFRWRGSIYGQHTPFKTEAQARDYIVPYEIVVALVEVPKPKKKARK